MTPQEREERRRGLKAKRIADRPRLAEHLMRVVNDASDYQNAFVVPLDRSEIYTIYDALTEKAAQSAE